MESETLKCMRSMAWERAKGELKAMLWTFRTEYAPGNGKIISSNFDELEKRIGKFIKVVEDSGLQE